MSPGPIKRPTDRQPLSNTPTPTGTFKNDALVQSSPTVFLSLPNTHQIPNRACGATCFDRDQTFVTAERGSSDRDENDQEEGDAEEIGEGPRKGTQEGKEYEGDRIERGKNYMGKELDGE